jgi:glyoxylase-like metal-dependent hydrolase (beta-lactamase superfamily II)
MDDPDGLRATDPVTRSGEMVVAGRPLVVNLAPYAATEGDVWIVDPRAGLAIVGDLVVGLVPFMDTACPEGWRAALDTIAATQFTTLVPGHGEAMDRNEFLQWRTAFNNLLDCAGSAKAKAECVAGWRRDAAAFIPAGDEQRVDGMVGYYLDSRLRAPPEERRWWCPKASASAGLTGRAGRDG